MAVDELTGTWMGDRDVWARQIINSRSARRKAAPARVDLETAILGIDIDDTIRGSSVITLEVADPDWELMDSEFFDVGEDGRLDPIDVNYPEGSEYWWRLTMLGIRMRGGLTLQLHFMERAATHMMSHRGPVKAARGKTTRAEFIKSLSDRVKAGGGIRFHSRELHATQRVAGGTLAEEKPDRKRKREKARGISRDERITFTNWDGSSYTLKPGELQNAEEVLDECFALTQDSRSIMSCLTACIVEAPFFRNPTGGHSSSVGILQLLNIHLGGSVSARRDIRRVVRLYMRDGFTGRGGAIELARQHPEWSVGRIAQAVQGSAYPDRYDKVKDGARKVLDAYGGEGGVTTSRRRAYHFTIGSPEDPKEDYWEGSQRLADEVEWPLFLDGQDLYFDPETVLIRQRPAAIIRRTSPSVITFDCDWDTRQIATEATLELICAPLEFRAGEVFKLEEFGPASIGSTVGLPGRWLIEEVKRNRFSLASTFTLKQPEAPKPEPAPEVSTSTRGGSSGAGGGKITTSGGAKGIVDQAVRIATQIHDGIYVASALRVGDPLDHGSNDANRAARDIAFRGRDALTGPPHPALDEACEAIMAALGEKYRPGSVVTDPATGKPFRNLSLGGYRVQVIWRTPAYGGHMGHIHIGVRRGG